MIIDVYKPIDEESAQSIELAQGLIESDEFMAGLGENCQQFPVPSGFPQISDIDRSVYLMVSQDMWDEPEETRQDQFFPHFQGGEVQGYPRYEQEDVLRRDNAVLGKGGELFPYLMSRMNDKIEHHKIIEYQLALDSSSKTRDQIEEIVVNVYADMTSVFIMTIVEAGFYGGLATWPIAQRFYECLQTGGIPTGWVGEVPEKGGKAHECVQLLHYGPRAEA